MSAKPELRLEVCGIVIRILLQIFCSIRELSETDCSFIRGYARTESVVFSVGITTTLHGIAHWNITSKIDFYAGGGAELMLRLNNDDRSQATSGVQPMGITGVYFHSNKFAFNLPFWARFYANGMSVTVLPEPSYKIKPRLELFLRNEISWLALYDGKSQEWRNDLIIGCYVYL